MVQVADSNVLVYDNLTLRQFDNRYYVIVPPAAAIVVFNDERKILLTREYRPNTGKWHWYLPAGRKQEQDASIEDTIRREVSEEAHLGVRHITPMYQTESKSAYVKWDKYFYMGYGTYHKPPPSGQEGDEEYQPEAHFFTPAEVIEKLKARMNENAQLVRGLDDDMGDAVQYFLLNHVLFKKDWVRDTKHHIQQKIESGYKFALRDE